MPAKSSKSKPIGTVAKIQEAHRILKPGGLLVFTFHHGEDAPWVSVLESLFQAGFYLEATYPIRSDETKLVTEATLGRLASGKEQVFIELIPR